MDDYWAKNLSYQVDEESYGYREMTESPPYRPSTPLPEPAAKTATRDDFSGGENASNLPPAVEFKDVPRLVINALQQPLTKPVDVESAISPILATSLPVACFKNQTDNRAGPVSDWNANNEYVLRHLCELLKSYEFAVKQNLNPSVFTTAYDKVQLEYNIEAGLLLTSYFCPPSIADMMERTTVFYCPKGHVSYRKFRDVSIRPISQSVIEYSCQGFSGQYPNYDHIRADRVNFNGEVDLYVEYVTSIGGFDIFVPHHVARRPVPTGITVDYTPFTRSGDPVIIDESNAGIGTYFVKTQIKSAIFFHDILYTTNTRDQLLPVPINVLRDTRLHLISTPRDKDYLRTATRYAARLLKDMDLPPDLVHKITDLIGRMVMASELDQETMALTTLVSENSGMFRAYNAALNFEPLQVVTKGFLLGVIFGLLIFAIILYNELPYFHHELAIVSFALVLPIAAYFIAPSFTYKSYFASLAIIIADTINTGLFLLKKPNVPPWVFILCFFIVLLAMILIVNFYSLSTSSTIERIQNSIPTEGSTQTFKPNMSVKRLVNETRPDKSVVRESLKIISPGEVRIPKKEPTSVVGGPIVPSNDYVVSVEGTSQQSVLAALEVRQGKVTKPQGETYSRMVAHAKSEGGLLYKLKKHFNIDLVKSIFEKWVRKFSEKRQVLLRKAREETQAPGFLDTFKPEVTSVFGKIQKNVFKSEDGDPIVKAQRIIISPVDHVKVLCGPWIQEITHQFKAFFMATAMYIYAPGSTNDVIGDKMYQFYVSHANVYFIEADLVKADASVDRPIHTLFREFLYSLGIPRYVGDYLHPKVVTYTNRNGLYAVDEDPRLGSGRDDTSLIMTLLVLMFWDWFLTLYFASNFLIAAGGDDSLALVRGDKIDHDTLVNQVKTAFQSTSLEAEILVTNLPHRVTFYSKILVPCWDSKLKTETWCLTPMPGRLIARLAVDLHLLSAFDKVSQFTTLLGDCVFAPFIGVYLKHFLELYRVIAAKERRQQGRKPAPLIEEWATHNNNKALKKSTKSYTFFELRYNLTQADEDSLIKYLSTVTSPYTVLDHYTLTALIKVDN